MESVEEEEEGHKVNSTGGVSVSSKWELRDRRDRVTEAQMSLKRLGEGGLNRQLLVGEGQKTGKVPTVAHMVRPPRV